jgi:hypothetical protein
VKELSPEKIMISENIDRVPILARRFVQMPTLCAHKPYTCVCKYKRVCIILVADLILPFISPTKLFIKSKKY